MVVVICSSIGGEDERCNIWWGDISTQRDEPHGVASFNSTCIDSSISSSRVRSRSSSLKPFSNMYHYFHTDCCPAAPFITLNRFDVMSMSCRHLENTRLYSACDPTPPHVVPFHTPL